MTHFETSETITNISAKLLAAQKKGASVKKDANNPFFKSKYADLSQYLEVLTPIFNEVGIIVNQFPAGEVLITQVIDPETGEFFRSGYLINGDKDPQKVGSALLIAKRNILAAIFLVLTKDDDANSASGKVTPKRFEWCPPVTDTLIEEFKKKYKTIEDIKADYEKISASNMEKLKVHFK